MGDWLQQHITGPIIVALSTGVIVPLAIAYFRSRRTVSEIGEGLSKSEATFRADLIMQINNLRQQYDEVHQMLLDCQKNHAEAEIEIAKLRAEIEAK